MNVMSKTIQWDGAVPVWAASTLAAPGGLVVCATKVGYILMTTDGPGLERKFDAKQRNRNKHRAGSPGRNFRQPWEGLGFDGSPVAHMWRTVIWPNN